VSLTPSLEIEDMCPLDIEPPGVVGPDEDLLELPPVPKSAVIKSLAILALSVIGAVLLGGAIGFWIHLLIN